MEKDYKGAEIMAKSATDKSKTAEELINEQNKKRISQLRTQIREQEKEIKKLESVSQRDAYLAEWKAVGELKQKFKNELKSHKQLKRMSWKRFLEKDDYFEYAEHRGAYSVYAMEETQEWVQTCLSEGKTLAELADNAKRIRQGRYDRMMRAIRKKEREEKKKEAEALLAAEKAKKKQDDVDIKGKATLEEHLGNG